MLFFHIRWSLIVAGDSGGLVARTRCQEVTHRKDVTDGDFAGRPAAGRFAFPAHPSARAAWSSSHNPLRCPPLSEAARPISHAPFPRWAPLLAPVASSTAPAECSSDAQGCGRDVPGGRVQLNGYWKRLATALDPLVAAPSGKRLHSTLELRACSSAPWTMGTGQRAHPCRRAGNGCSDARCPGLRSAPLLRAGMQRLQQRHGLERLLA
jgi:hypothetical protein